MQCIAALSHLRMMNVKAKHFSNTFWYAKYLILHLQSSWFCVINLFQPPTCLSFTLFVWSLLFRCAFFVPVLLFCLSFFLFITSGVQLASIVAPVKNDVINYLGRDYVIKPFRVCVCVCVCVYVCVCELPCLNLNAALSMHLRVTVCCIWWPHY